MNCPTLLSTCMRHHSKHQAILLKSFAGPAFSVLMSTHTHTHTHYLQWNRAGCYCQDHILGLSQGTSQVGGGDYREFIIATNKMTAVPGEDSNNYLLRLYIEKVGLSLENSHILERVLIGQDYCNAERLVAVIGFPSFVLWKCGTKRCGQKSGKFPCTHNS